MVGPGISHKASAIETGWRQENSNPTQFTAAVDETLELLSKRVLNLNWR